jgi:hypothetical protein
MELLRDAEPVVEASAALFEDAGLGSFANSLRQGLPLKDLESAFECAAVLQEAQDLAGIDPEVDRVMGELAFWAQGAILAAADGEIDLFNDCLRMVRRVVAVLSPSFAVH